MIRSSVIVILDVKERKDERQTERKKDRKKEGERWSDNPVYLMLVYRRTSGLLPNIFFISRLLKERQTEGERKKERQKEKDGVIILFT